MRSDFSLKYEIRPAFGVLCLVRKTHTELLSAVLEGLDAFRFFFKILNTSGTWGFMLGPQNAHGITFCGVGRFRCVQIFL